jgi:hypothetical protein
LSKSPSALGTEIESAVAARYVRHRNNVQYLGCFRTAKGSVFAFERVTLKHINLWLPEQDAAKREAERVASSVVRSVPWPNGRGSNYGRISSLESVPELCDEPLLRIQVVSASDAIQILEALT